ncbi:hypothetical protein GCM10022215_22930 [Nocardioides fonticola]|uniref:histidine kinase n=1 Tax=Nocardioides fonticola TaxID=450363 RepID=A0ABP7XK53_9ACTN
MEWASLYRDIVESSPDGIWVIDLGGRTVYANPRLAELAGRTAGETDDLTLDDLPAQSGIDRLRARIAEVVAGGVCGADVEIRWPRADGDDVWTLAGCTLLMDAQGHPSAVRLRFIDFSDRRLMHEALRESEEALRDQIAQNELMQAIVSAANEATTLREVLMRARDLVLVHDDWSRARAFLHEDGRLTPLHLDEADRMADALDPFAEVEVALAERCLESRSLEWDERRLTLAFPVLLDDVVHAVIVITSAPPLYRFGLIETMAVRVADQVARVIERERVQGDLARARDDAMAASRQKSEFLATMSHEIRTPLNGVIGLGDLLLRTELTPEQLRLATGVQIASRALLGVINDILDFSKIEAGRLELEHVDFEVRPLLDQVAAMLTETARSKGLDMVVSCHPQVPARLRGDPTRLAQVLTNLVSNAVKFTQRGGVIVRAMAAPDGDQVRLSVEVSDTGIGIAPAEVPSLFEPFTQADASTTRLYGGTGLGLAIAKEIVEAMDGRLRYSPNLGGGSVFAFSVLLDTASGVAGASEDVRARAALQGVRALVVDDTEHNRIIVEEQLSWWGVASDSAQSAAEAMTLLEHSLLDADHRYAVVLLDLAMPQQDGLDLARAIRSRPEWADLRLLMLTSVTGVDRDTWQAAGIDDVLPKPVLATTLRSALLELLAAPEPAADPATAGPVRGRVLVVEDNPVNQMVATGLLAALGYESITADDGEVAVDLALDPAIDAVLMDIQMPRMDGYAATRAIRQQPAGRRKPIIAMTAAAVEGERDRCLEAGMDDFLTKPVDPAALAETLAHWLGDEAPAAATAPPAAAAPAVTGPGGGAEADVDLDLTRLSMLRDLDPDDTVYLDRAIDNFVANCEAALEAMRAAVDARDAAALRAVAHKLAGGALNLGAMRAGEAVRSIEHLATDGDVEQAAARLIPLEDHLDRAREALLAYRRSYQAARPPA